MTNLQLAGLFATNPRQAYAALKESPRFVLAMLIVLLSSLGPVAWYYAQVDPAWLGEQMRAQVIAAGGDASNFQAIGPTVLMVSTLIFGSVILVGVVAISALYFLIVTRITGLDLPFRHWFAFNWWSSTPTLIAAIPMVLVMLLGDARQMDIAAVQPLSLNELIFHRTADQPGYTLLTNVTLLHIVSAWFTVLGVRVWSNRSLLYSLIVGLAPTVLIYGIWALVAFS